MRRKLLVLAFWLVGGFAAAEVLSEGRFEIDYPEGQAALARKTLDVLQQAAAELEGRLPLGEAPVHVIVCASHEEFARLAGRFAQSDVGGIAESDTGRIVVKTPRLQPPGGSYPGTLRHELVHVLLARNTDEANLPRWLNEGIAMVLSREYRWNSRFRVAMMYLQGQLISYGMLNFALAEPGTEAEFGDAYAQSLLMTDFLMDRVGEDRFWALVGALRTESFGAALRREAGLTPAEFWEAWRRSLWKVALVWSIVSGFSIFQVGALLVVLAYIRKWRRGKRLVQEWETEDRPTRYGRTDEDEDYLFPWEEDDEYY